MDGAAVGGDGAGLDFGEKGKQEWHRRAAVGVEVLNFGWKGQLLGTRGERSGGSSSGGVRVVDSSCRRRRETDGKRRKHGGYRGRGRDSGGDWE